MAALALGACERVDVEQLRDCERVIPALEGPGGMLGGVLIALLETFWSAYLTVAYKDLAVFALLAFLLALRPEGLLGRKPWPDA